MKNKFMNVVWLLGIIVLATDKNALRAQPTGSLVVCDDIADPATLDPQKQFTEKNRTILQQIYEELLRLDEHGNFKPLLAESWERLDPLTVRFKLRQNVYFHHGEHFTADAVKYTIDRYLDPTVGFPGAAFVSSIASATIVDTYTVDIRTHFPDGLLLNRIAAIILIVPASPTGSRVSIEDKPNGTGPFRFDHWEKGKEIVLKANPKYWRLGFPKVAELKFRFLPIESQMEELLSGKVDLVTEMPGTMTLKVRENPKTTVIKKETFSTVAGLFNTRRGPLSDRRVRQALNYAINKEELIRYDLLGNGRILASLTMEGEVGHNKGLKPYAYDRAKASALLTEAGYPNGFKLKTLVRAQGERTAKIIAKQLESVHVALEIQAVKSDAEIIAAFQGNEWDFGIAALPDPMAHSFFIQSIILFSKSPFSLQRDAEYDKRLVAMMSEIDPVKQESLAQDLDAYIHDESLCVFTYQRLRTYGVSKRLKFSPYITGIHYFDSTEIQ